MTNSRIPNHPHQTLTLIGFTDKELAKPKKAFTRSFFKFDFYDSPLRKEQKIMFTNIMSLNNCIKGRNSSRPRLQDPTEYYSQIADNMSNTSMFMGCMFHIAILLGPLHGRSENYYIQWLKDRELTEIR